MATLIHAPLTPSSTFQTENANSFRLKPSFPNAGQALRPIDSDGPKRILLVDDDEEIRSLVRAFLQSDGHEVFCCAEGHRASELFRKRNDIDLLLTDLHMPGISGIVLANQLTTLRPTLPVIIMSGMMLNEGLENVIASNGWRFLAKPFQVPRLLDIVHELLAVTVLSA